MRLQDTYPSLFVSATGLGTDTRDQRGCSSCMFLFLGSYRHTLDDVASQGVSSAVDRKKLCCTFSLAIQTTRMAFRGSRSSALDQRLHNTPRSHVDIKSLMHLKRSRFPKPWTPQPLSSFRQLDMHHTYMHYRVSLTIVFRTPPRQRFE